MIRRNIIVVLALITVCFFSAPAIIADINLDVEIQGETGKPGISLTVELPVSASVDLSGYSLKINIKGEGISREWNFIGEQITAGKLAGGAEEIVLKKIDSDVTGRSKLEYKITLRDELSGVFEITIALYKNEKLLSLVKKLVTVNPDSPDIHQGEVSSSTSQHSGGVTRRRKADYRERFIYGEIRILRSEWPRFNLVLEAVRTDGGGRETASIIITKPGVYSYRLGNLYPRKYRFRLINLESDEGERTVDFTTEPVSRRIDFNINDLEAVDIGIYSLEATNVEKTDDGFVYHLKAYICRFDSSPVRNLTFSWRSGGKIYTGAKAPEKNKCIPIYPEPVKIKGGDIGEIELILHPEDNNTTGKNRGSRIIRFMYDTNRTNDRYKLRLGE
jgi:hypothetical protein